jgi:hypothetical protein
MLGFHPTSPGMNKLELPNANQSAIDRVQEMQDIRDLAAQALRESSESYHKWYNKGRIRKSFKVGDWVMISTKHLNLRRPSRKLAEKYAGPYQIEGLVGTSGLAYRLRLPSSVRIHNVFNVTNLEEFHSRDGAPSEPTDHPFSPDETFEIEEIVSHRYKGKRRLYYIKWKDYPSEENTWIKRSDFNDKETRDEYDRRVDATAPRRRR